MPRIRQVWGQAWQWGAGVITTKLLLVVVALVATTVVLAAGLPQLEFSSNQEAFVNSDTQVARDNEAYQDAFGGQAMVVLWEAPAEEMLTGDSLEQLIAIEEDVRAIDNVKAVIGPITALEWASNQATTPARDGESLIVQDLYGRALERETDPDEVERREADLGVSTQRALESGANLNEVDFPAELSNPGYRDLLLFDNQAEIRTSLKVAFPDLAPTAAEAPDAPSGVTRMIVRLEGNLDIESEGEAATAVVDAVDARDWGDVTYVATGAPILLKGIQDYLQGGMMTLGAIAFGVMAVVLVLVFAVRWRLLPLLSMLMGIVWAFGLLGWLGIPLTLVTISGLPILIGLGVDFAIQVHSRTEEESALDQVDDPAAHSLVRLGPPLMLATVVGAGAFLALQVSEVPMLRDFGVLLAIGIAALFVSGTTLPGALLGSRERRRPTRERKGVGGRIERSVVFLGSTPQRFVIPMIIAGIGLIVAGTLLEDQFKIESDPLRWVDQDTQVVADLDRLDQLTGSSSELGVFIEADDVTTDEVVAFAAQLGEDQTERREGELLSISSVPATVQGTIETTPNQEDVDAVLGVAPDDIVTQLMFSGPDTDEFSKMNLIFAVGPISLDERAVLLEEISQDLEGFDLDGEVVALPPDARATPSGLAVIGVELLNGLTSNRALLTYLALGAAALILLAWGRSIAKMVLTLVPVMIAVGTTSVVVSVLGFELSPITTISGPLVIATCAEFSVLILGRYVEERERGLSTREATDVASARTGRAFVASALTTVGGFGVLAFSALPLLRDFGLIVALNVAVALLSALVILPPLLVWADERGWIRLRTPQPDPVDPTPVEPTPVGVG